jgi:phosphoglycerate kinase
MEFGIRTMDDVDVAGKTVLCRIDINQPVDRKTGTLQHDAHRGVRADDPGALDKGAKVVLMAHQGSDIEYQNYYTLEPHSRVLAKLSAAKSCLSRTSADRRPSKRSKV